MGAPGTPIVTPPPTAPTSDNQTFMALAFEAHNANPTIIGTMPFIGLSPVFVSRPRWMPNTAGKLTPFPAASALCVPGVLVNFNLKECGPPTKHQTIDDKNTAPVNCAGAHRFRVRGAGGTVRRTQTAPAWKRNENCSSPSPGREVPRAIGRGHSV